MTGLLALLAVPLLGQVGVEQHDPESFVNQQRLIDEQVRAELDRQQAEDPRGLFDWGGWYNFFGFAFDDGVNSSRTLRRYDLRLWGRARLMDGAHEFYVRTRLSFVDFNAGDSFDGDEDDVEGPNLERGYYRFDWAGATQAAEGVVLDYNVVVAAGRDLVQFGTGLALATPLDHVSIQGRLSDFELTGLAGKTVGGTQDFDLSRTADRTRRNFFGAQVKYQGIQRHEPFAYVFWQKDNNDESRFTLLQRYDYDSVYAGLGSTGEWFKGLRYGLEWVYETGEDYGHRRFFGPNDIRAWAGLTTLEYLFSGPHQARASVEYLFGSGDPNRAESPTNTVNGNRGDSGDTSFIGFGYHNTGLSFAPRYSNLHMWRVGASYFPFPNSARFRELEIGSDWFLYYKHHGLAGVSDPTATITSNYLGWEMDYYWNWRVDADLSWTARLGAFFPGSAFDDQTIRTFFLVGAAWSF